MPQWRLQRGIVALESPFESLRSQVNDNPGMCLGSSVLVVDVRLRMRTASFLFQLARVEYSVSRMEKTFLNCLQLRLMNRKGSKSKNTHSLPDKLPDMNKIDIAVLFLQTLHFSVMLMCA